MLSGSNITEPLSNPRLETLTPDSSCKMTSLIKSLDSFPGLSSQVAMGHLGSVWSCTITSDNLTFFSGSDDKTVKIWDFITRQCLHTFTLHTHTVNTLLLTQQDKYLVSADWNGKLLVWDWNRRELHKELVAHTCSIYALSQSRDEKFMLSGGRDSVIFIWKNENFECIGQVNCEGNSVFALACESSFNEFCCGGWGGVIRVFSSNDLTLKSSFDGKAGIIQTMDLSRNNEFLIIGTRNNLVKVFKYKDQTEYFSFNSHENWVRSLVILPDDDLFISVSADKTLRIFSLLRKTEVFCVERKKGYFFVGCISKNGEFLLTGSSDKKIQIWNLGQKSRVQELIGHEKSVLALCVSDDDKYLVTGSEDKTVRIWSLDDYCQLALLNGHSGSVWAVAVTPDCKYVVSASDDKTVILWDFAEKVIKFQHYLHKGPVFCVCFNSTGRFVVSGAQDKNLVFWDLGLENSFEKIESKVLSGHSDPVFAVKFTPDDQCIVSAAADYTLRIWSSATLQKISKIETKSGIVESICFTSDSKTLSTSDRSSNIHIYDWASKACIGKFTKHTSRVRSLSFSKTNEFLASASSDNSVRIWNWKEERQEFMLIGHLTPVRAVKFLNSSKAIVTAGEDSKIRVWDICKSDELELTDVTIPLESVLFLMSIQKKVVCSKLFKDYTFGQIRVNLAHFYAYMNEDVLLDQAFLDGVDLKKDLQNKTPLSYALARTSQKSIEVILKHLIRIKSSNFSKFLVETRAISVDFTELLSNSSYFLSNFIEELFYSVPNLPTLAFVKSELPILSLSDLPNIQLPSFIYSTNENPPLDSYEVPIEFKSLPFPVNFDFGSEDSLEILRSIIKCPDNSLLQTLFIRSYIQWKWDKLWGFILSLTFATWLNLVIMASVLIKLYSKRLDTEPDQSLANLTISFIVLNSIIFIYDILKIFSIGLQYFLHFWNLVHTIRSISCLTWSVLSLYHSQETLYISTWFMVICNFFQGLSGFRAFSITRYYTRLITRALTDSCPFLLIFFYSTFSFGVIFFISQQGSEHSISSLWTSPYQLSMGEISQEYINHPAGYIYFMLTTVINIIVMLNLLISILGDSFDSFQIDAVKIDCLEQAQLVLEIENAMFWNRGLGGKKFLQLAQRESGKGKEEWQGKVVVVLNSVVKMREDFEDLKKMVQRIDEKIDKKFGLM